MADLPEVGTLVTYKGVNGEVVATRKIGRGYSVCFRPLGDSIFEWVRLKDWRQGVQS